MADRRFDDDDDDDPDAPPTAEEVAAAARLRDALAGGDGDPLVGALRAAWSPGPLGEREHAAVLDDMPSSAGEIRLAAAMRDRLGDDPAVAALAAAWRPTELPAADHEAILVRTVTPVTARSNVVALRFRRAALATTTVLAFAASVVVWIGNTRTADVPLAHARSTQSLFDEPFRSGETSARIDRIALARAADLRDNQFAKWGAR